MSAQAPSVDLVDSEEPTLQPQVESADEEIPRRPTPSLLSEAVDARPQGAPGGGERHPALFCANSCHFGPADPGRIRFRGRAGTTALMAQESTTTGRTEGSQGDEAPV
jgi:hypothetical protein